MFCSKHVSERSSEQPRDEPQAHRMHATYRSFWICDPPSFALACWMAFAIPSTTSVLLLKGVRLMFEIYEVVVKSHVGSMLLLSVLSNGIVCISATSPIYAGDLAP